MSKQEIRGLLIRLKPFIKLSTFCKLAGISNTSLSLFMRSSEHDYQISQEKLDLLVNTILSFMSNYA